MKTGSPHPQVITLRPSPMASDDLQRLHSEHAPETPLYRLVERYPNPILWRICSVRKQTLEKFIEKNKGNKAILTFSIMTLFSHRISHRLVKYPLTPYPNRSALEYSARTYNAKYGVHIFVSDVSTLFSLVRKIELRVTKPTFVGFVVAYDQGLDSGHVAPMIAALGAEKNTQFIMMDTLDYSDDFSLGDWIRLRLVPAHDETSNFICAQGGRQADEFSCRTGATTLLRNALLSLKAQGNPTAYWREVFHHAKEKLPLEWTYVEQIHHASKEEQEHSVAIRDLFAKSELKRQHPRSVYKYREDHSEELEIEHSIFCPSEGTPLEPSFESIKPPEGSSFKIESGGVILTYTTHKRINTYLLHKGFKNMARLKASPATAISKK